MAIPGYAVAENLNPTPIFQYSHGGPEELAPQWTNSTGGTLRRNTSGNIEVSSNYGRMGVVYLGDASELGDFDRLYIRAQHNLRALRIRAFWGSDYSVPGYLVMTTLNLPSDSGWAWREGVISRPPDRSGHSGLYLVLDNLNYAVLVHSMNVSRIGQYGQVVHGDLEPGGDLAAAWTGQPWASASYIYDTTNTAEPEPEPTEVEAPAPTWTDYSEGGGEWTTPEVEGVTYSPASGTAAPGEAVTVTATALDGYVLTGVTEWTHTFPELPEPDPEPDPDPEPEPDPEPDPELPEPDPDPELPEPDPDPELPEPDPELPDEEGEMYQQIAERVAAYLGTPDDEELIETAKAHAPTVVAFVKGYTRGNGFSEGGVPENPLVHVIVSSCSRLAANPEQFTYFAALDFQARPTVFNGWTLPELAVLNQYRKRWA